LFRLNPAASGIPETDHNLGLGRMRIISGRTKGHTLRVPRGRGVRPTASRVREALFSILSERIHDARVLDLFAGSGALGIEALSRGASEVVFVDQAPDALRTLSGNLKRCGYEDRAILLRVNSLKFLKEPGIHPVAFDVVLVDPPYHTGILRKLLPLLSRGVIMKPSGIMVIEHFHKTVLPDRIGRLEAVRSGRYGDTMLTFYRKAEGAVT
jgi:16S rRNA (guanine966-N2)-methyltransferase